MDTWALIPVKSLENSKARLAHLLSATERAALIARLLQHELAVLQQVEGIGQVLVVSSDPIVWGIAARWGALVEKEAAPVGLNLAVARGMAVAAERGARRVLVLPVDLPFISASDVQTLLRAGEALDAGPNGAATRAGDKSGICGASSAQLLTICADEAGEGTNALLLDPATSFTFHYGPGSFQQHLAEAARRGLLVQVVSVPGLQFDLDGERDWYAYQLSLA